MIIHSNMFFVLTCTVLYNFINNMTCTLFDLASMYSITCCLVEQYVYAEINTVWILCKKY